RPKRQIDPAHLVLNLSRFQIRRSEPAILPQPRLKVLDGRLRRHRKADHKLRRLAIGLSGRQLDDVGRSTERAGKTPLLGLDRCFGAAILAPNLLLLDDGCGWRRLLDSPAGMTEFVARLNQPPANLARLPLRMDNRVEFSRTGGCSWCNWRRCLRRHSHF